MLLLRANRLLHRLVLLAYALTLSVAAAAPLLQPTAMDQVCAASGLMQWAAAAGAEGDGDNATRPMLDCALCSPAAPPQARPVPLAQPQPHADHHPARAQGHIAGATGAPLPARGPPAQA